MIPGVLSMLWSSWVWPSAPHRSCPPCSMSSCAHTQGKGETNTQEHIVVSIWKPVTAGICRFAGGSKDFPSLGQLVPCWITELEKLETTLKWHVVQDSWGSWALLRVCMVTVCSSGFEVRTLTGIVVCSWSPCQSLKLLLQGQGLALSKFRPLGLSQHSLHDVLPCPFSWGMCFCNAVSGNAFLGDLNSSHQSWKDDFYQGVSLTGWVSVRHRWCVRAFGPVTS